MIYIDFPAGAHGHFLEFIILKHVMRVPEYKNFLPFTTLGTSHLKPTITNTNVIAGHFTQQGRTPRVVEADLVIQIPVHKETTALDFIYYGNILTRVGDGVFDLKKLEENTLEKLNHTNKFSNLQQTITQEVGYKKNYPRAYLRNLFYAQIREISRSFTTFNQFNCKSTTFDFKNFYRWEDFLFEVNKVAIITNHPEVDAKLLFDDYQLFLKNNSVLRMKNNVFSFLDAIQFNLCEGYNLNILEEAFLNTLITNKFNIHSDLSTFDDYYSQDSVTIATEIKKILHKRNSEFSLNLPIAYQFEKIVLEF